MKLQKRPPGSDTEKFAHKLGGGSDSGGGGVGGGGSGHGDIPTTECAVIV